DSLPDLGRNGSTSGPGMGGDAARPGNLSPQGPRPIRRFAERNFKHRGAAMRAAAANGNAARLQRTFEEDGGIVYAAVGAQVGAPDALQGRLEAVLSGAEG